MFTVKHILTDQEAVDLRDELIEAYPVDPLDPVEPVDPPKPPDPVDPPAPVDPSMKKLSFKSVYGSDLVMPLSASRPKVYPLKHLKSLPKAGMTMAIQLPVITADCELRVSTAAANVHGSRRVVFSWYRGFLDFLTRQFWGTTSLKVPLTRADSRKILHFNADMPGSSEENWDLKVQFFMLIQK